MVKNALAVLGMINLGIHLLSGPPHRPGDRLEAALKTKLIAVQGEVGFPGATLALVLPGGREISVSTGLSDKENKIPMRPRDRMFAGSVGKTFVAATVLQLHTEGKISLDQPVAPMFSDAPWFDRIPNAARLTVRMLLCHTTGIPRHIFTESFKKELLGDPDRVWRPAELLAHVAGLDPLHAAGNGWAYSDTNYIILGMIVEKTAGAAFYAEVERRFLTPLQLSDTLPAVRRDLPGLVCGYTGKEPFGFPPRVVVGGRYVINPQFEWTGGGLLSNSLDLARWAYALYGGKVLSPDALAAMLSPLDYQSGRPAETGYGLGVQVWNSAHGPVYGHSGTFPGYQTQMAYLPRRGFSIAMQINSDRTVLPKARDLYRFFEGFFGIVTAHLTPPTPPARPSISQTPSG
jgi:D-alanyl-D-alanine carboxypeptidase